MILHDCFKIYKWSSQADRQKILARMRTMQDYDQPEIEGL